MTPPTAPELPVQREPSYARPDRSANEIRRDLVRTREELTRSLEALRNKVGAMTDVKRQFREHRTEILAGAAIAGFLVGGLVALRRRRY